jgi:hypothetical protein
MMRGVCSNGLFANERNGTMVYYSLVRVMAGSVHDGSLMHRFLMDINTVGGNGCQDGGIIQQYYAHYWTQTYRRIFVESTGRERLPGRQW